MFWFMTKKTRRTPVRNYGQFSTRKIFDHPCCVITLIFRRSLKGGQEQIDERWCDPQTKNCRFVKSATNYGSGIYFITYTTKTIPLIFLQSYAKNHTILINQKEALSESTKKIKKSTFPRNLRGSFLAKQILLVQRAKQFLKKTYEKLGTRASTWSGSDLQQAISAFDEPVPKKTNAG